MITKQTSRELVNDFIRAIATEPEISARSIVNLYELLATEIFPGADLNECFDKNQYPDEIK